MSTPRPAPKMDFGPWRVVIVGPHYFGRYGYTITLKNNWLTMTSETGGLHSWTHKSAVRRGRRWAAKENREGALRDNPEVIPA
jgi:hypothetical protein